MEILPAIDLLGGKCVRLIQGRYDRIIEYESDPVEVAERFKASGAAWLHVVDLDGARSGAVVNLAALGDIVQATGLHVEFGGGLRDESSIHKTLDAGAQRAIIGTRGLEDPDWFRAMAHHPAFAGRLALGLDARLGKLAVHGWTRDTQQLATDVARAVADWPLAAIVYTDIGRDGLLLGPNLQSIESLAAVATTPIIASGGVSDLEDVQRLKQIGLEGVVIGRAIYEGTLTLGDALAVARAT